MLNVAYIESPTQLLNLIEYAGRYALKIDFLLLNRRSQTSTRNLRQMNQLLAFLPVENKMEVDFEPKLKQLSTIKDTCKRVKEELDSEFSAARPSYRIIIGEYRSVLGWSLSEYLKSSKRIVLDDGSATMRMNRKNLIRSFSSFCVSAFYYALGLPYLALRGSEFFSVYDITKRLKSRDTLIRNDFRYLRSMLLNKPADETVFIIGTPLKEAGVTTADDIAMTRKLIEKVKQKTNGKPLIYVSHRRERNGKLKALGELVEIRQYDFPFEFYSILTDRRLKYAAGFYSTLFDNLYHMLGEDELELTLFDLGSIKIEANYANLIKNMYQNYRNYGYKVESFEA